MMTNNKHKLAGLSSGEWAEIIRSKISNPVIQVVVANAVWWDCFGNSSNPNPEMRFFIEIWREWEIGGVAKRKAATVKLAELARAFRAVGYGSADAKQRAKSFCSRNYEHEPMEPKKSQLTGRWDDDY